MNQLTFLSLSEICLFANASPSSRNFVAGEKLTNAKHIIFIGKTSEDEKTVALTAYCLQTSHLRDKPHEINIVINKDGKISSAKCTCKAGLSEKCKHIVGTLIYCSRNDLSQISVISCTDKKCTWSTPQGETLKNYVGKPLAEHECFQAKKSRTELNLQVEISEEQEKLIKNLLRTDPQSALHKHACGRNDPILQIAANPMAPVPTPDPATAHHETIKSIFSNRTSGLLQTISDIPFQPLLECCLRKIEQLNNTDSLLICQQTKISHKLWKKERQFRITGSRCYEIFTYTNNSKPNWMQKAIKYFYPKDFVNVYTRHGLKYEEFARKKYEEITNERVIECGLVVPPSNCWLGYSPDGLIFHDQKLKKLIEIKCPYEGRQCNIFETAKTLKYLEKDGLNNFKLKTKHAYYAQVQLGMTILNLDQTDFILYSSFDESLMIIPIKFDEPYTTKLLMSLKGAYFNNMIHYTCTAEES